MSEVFEVPMEVKRVVEFTSSQVERSKDIIIPMFYISKGEKMEMVACPFRDEFEKVSAGNFIREKAKKMEADFVMFVSESWALALTKEEQDEFQANREKWPQVKDHPKAIDIIMFQYQSKDALWLGKSKVTIAEDGSKSVDPCEWVKTDKGTVSGKMANWL